MYVKMKMEYNDLIKIIGNGKVKSYERGTVFLAKLDIGLFGTLYKLNCLVSGEEKEKILKYDNSSIHILSPEKEEGIFISNKCYR